MSRNEAGILQWDDIPHVEEVKAKLVNAARFAFIWLADFEDQLQKAKTAGIRELNGLAWFDKFFRGTKNSLEATKDHIYQI